MNQKMRDKGFCGIQKCGEYNMLVCVREFNHSGDCCFIIDRENDYPRNSMLVPNRDKRASKCRKCKTVAEM
jgi:hypothetical protein